MLPEILQAVFHPFDTLSSHQATWGSQYFVELSIFVNLAVFEADKLKKYGRQIRKWVIKATAAAGLDFVDQDAKHAGAVIIEKVLTFGGRCHSCAWKICGMSAWASACCSVLILYLDKPNCSYYVLLLAPTFVYLTCVVAAMIGVLLFCLSVRGILGIHEPENPDDEIRKQLKSFHVHPTPLLPPNISSK